MGNLLLLGSGGTVGQGLQSLSSGGVTFISASKTKIEFGNSQVNYQDLSSVDSIIRLCGDGNVSAVAVLTGLSNPSECERNPDLSYRLNVEYPAALVEALTSRGIYSILFSSEYVYPSTSPPSARWCEHESAPVGTYGIHKLELERVTRRGLRSVLRLPKIVWLEPSLPGIFGRAVKELRSGDVVEVANDQIFTPLLGADLMRLVLFLQKCRLCGTYNVCQNNPVTRLQFYEAVAATLRSRGLPVANVVGVPFSTFGTAFVPAVTPMNNSRFVERTGFIFSDVIQSMTGVTL